MGRQSSGGWAYLLMVVGIAAILLIAIWWVVAIITIAGSILWWVWNVLRDDQPGEFGYALKRWLAPRWHYPFIGVGSALASVFGADAIHELVRGSNTALSIVILIIVVARSISMAWFPWPRTHPSGLRVYPWVALTGPLSSAIGMAGVWIMVIGGQTTGPVHNHAYWVAMSAAPAAILIMILSAAVGRIGRIWVPSSAPNRTDIDKLLALAAPGEEMALRQTPSPAPGHRTHLIPPMGPPEGPWAAARPSLRLNWRRLFWVPIAGAVGAGAAVVMAEVYRAGSPLPEAMGLMVAILILLRAVVGPLCFTFFYADQHWIGERGLWWKHGVSTRDYRCATSASHIVDLIGYEPRAPRASLRPMRVRLRLRWSEKQLGPIGVPPARPVEPGTSPKGLAC
ncbi:MAG: hypothetical protein ACYDEA_08220 [Candidatus Dormibacteria bacterium]